MSREALVLLVCCCDFRDGAERLISSKSLRNAVIRAFPGLFRILRMCAPRRAAAVVRPRGREKSADRRRRILISRLLIIRASVPRRKSPFPACFKGFPVVSPLIPPYPAFLKYPVSPHFDPELEHLSAFYDAEPSKRRYFVALDDAGQVVGGAGIAEFEGIDDCAELQKLYLDDSAKGKGCGKELMRITEEWARSAGYKKLYLETHSRLTAAVELYEKLGFRRIEKPSQTNHGTMDLFYIKRL